MGLVASGGLPAPVPPPAFAVVGGRPAAVPAVAGAAAHRARVEANAVGLAGEPRDPPSAGAATGMLTAAAGCRAAGAVAVVAAAARRRGALRHGRTVCAGFGPENLEMKSRKAAKVSDDVARRVAYVICENAKGIEHQLSQYGHAQIDGLLGGSVLGYPEQVRDEMKKLFDRGWFQQESEESAQFKICQWHISPQDRDHRFTSKLFGADPTSEKSMSLVETQYDIAPTVVNFTRSMVASLAPVVGPVFGGKISTNVAVGEMSVLCGNGARYDRRVNNEFGWNTKTGFAPDPRKLTAVYFCNPDYREELGGHLQLEGVITPTGVTSIPPIMDRLVLFWADKTVWSVRKSQASRISEHQFSIMINLMAEDFNHVEYDPRAFTRWFPELADKPLMHPPPGYNPDMVDSRIHKL